MQATQEKIPVRGFDFVLFLVKDLARARAFYEGIFDLSTGDFDSEYFVEYHLPDGNAFALAMDPSSDFAPCGGAMFAVDDVEVAIERVKSAGGTFFRNYGGQVCDSGWCADPDGNRFGVHKRKIAA